MAEFGDAMWMTFFRAIPPLNQQSLTSSPDEVLQPSSVEEVSHSPTTVTPGSNVPDEDDATQIESPPIAPVTPELRRSTRVSKPPQRLI